MSWGIGLSAKRSEPGFGEAIPSGNAWRGAWPAFRAWAIVHRARLRPFLMLGGIVAVGAVALAAWLAGGRYASSEDAYVRAAKLMVSTDVSGLVAEVAVREGQAVKRGEVLFRLDPSEFQIRLASARSALDETALGIAAMKRDYRRMLSDIDAQQAEVDLAQSNFDRFAVLVRTSGVSRADYDAARHALTAAKNRLESLRHQAEVQLARIGGDPELPVEKHPRYLEARARVDEAARQLDHTVVRAPFDGVVTQVAALQPGALLVSAMSAFSPTSAVGLVSTENVWVEAFMKETDLTWVRPGNPVSITVDTYPGRTWRGTVESISPATGAEFSVLPAQNASGNWVKVVQRIPVRIRLDRGSGDPVLRAGMSVVVTIDTGHRRTLADLF